MMNDGGLEVMFKTGETERGVGDFKKAMENYKKLTNDFSGIIDDQRKKGSTREHLQSIADGMVGQAYEDIELRAFLADRLAREEERGELKMDQLPIRQEGLKEEIMGLAKQMTPQGFTDALRANYNPLEVTKDNMTPEQRLRTAVMEYEMVSAVNQTKNGGDGGYATGSFRALHESMDMSKWSLNIILTEIKDYRF